MICKTLNEIDEAKPPTYEEMRENKNKWWREGFVAVKFCKEAKWNDALICFPANDAGDDVFVKYGGNSYPFQIAEMASRNPDVKNEFPQSNDTGVGLLVSEPYGSLKGEIKKFVCRLVKIKNNKHYASQDNMNLLLYLNTPDAVYIGADTDIDRAELAECVQSSEFKTISIYTGSEIIFIKGDIDSLAKESS